MMPRVVTITASVFMISLAFWLVLHNRQLQKVAVGMTGNEVRALVGPPSMIESPAAAHGESYEIKWTYRWYGPVAILAGHERWVYFKNGHVSALYDAQSP